MVVKSDGSVDSHSVRVIEEAHPALDAAAVKWAFTAVFWPACLDGQPVGVRILVPIEFSIRPW
jgi:TonB family protein